MSAPLFTLSQAAAWIEGALVVGDRKAQYLVRLRDVALVERNSTDLRAQARTNGVPGIEVRRENRSEDLGRSGLSTAVRRALRLRERVCPGRQSYRLIAGEADGLPGLIVDRRWIANQDDRLPIMYPGRCQRFEDDLWTYSPFIAERYP